MLGEKPVPSLRGPGVELIVLKNIYHCMWIKSATGSLHIIQIHFIQKSFGPNFLYTEIHILDENGFSCIQPYTAVYRQVYSYIKKNNSSILLEGFHLLCIITWFRTQKHSSFALKSSNMLIFWFWIKWVFMDQYFQNTFQLFGNAGDKLGWNDALFFNWIKWVWMKWIWTIWNGSMFNFIYSSVYGYMTVHMYSIDFCTLYMFNKSDELPFLYTRLSLNYNVVRYWLPNIGNCSARSKMKNRGVEGWPNIPICTWSLKKGKY